MKTFTGSALKGQNCEAVKGFCSFFFRQINIHSCTFYDVRVSMYNVQHPLKCSSLGKGQLGPKGASGSGRLGKG